MEKKKHNNPKRLRWDPSNNSWSELPQDLLNSVFERLGFPNFQRAKSVCSNWLSASRQSVPKNLQIPWLILFPEDDDNNKSNACTLFNPEEKDKLYKTQDMGVEFAKSVCITTYGSWLLMQDPELYLYILNLFTNEKINLPFVESQLGMVKVERTLNGGIRFSNDHRESISNIIIRPHVFGLTKITLLYVNSQYTVWLMPRKDIPPGIKFPKLHCVQKEFQNL